ncbi:MAG: TIGR03086 family protein [Actinobacteria bacterium]|nr:TIGR03086 family protein [Actinomycetota bacterium]
MDWRARYWESGAEVMRSLRKSPDALQRTCYLPYGTFPGDVALRIYLFDILIHGWDLATALDVPYAMDETATQVALEVARLVVTPEGRDQGQYGPPRSVSPLATTTDRLLALTGRGPL